jgi:predicted MFS family arabinose efflux permease
LSIIAVLLAFRGAVETPKAPMLSTPPPPQPPPPSPARAIAFLAIASFASQAMVRSVDALLPQIATDLGTSVGIASIVVTVYAFTHALVLIVVGPIGDRAGKYVSIAVACVISAVAVALCGLAQSLPTLTLARLASAVAVAWIVPLAIAFIGDVVPYERRQEVIGRFLAGQIAGQLFGQAAGGVIGDFFGWRTVFFVLAGLFAVAAVALAFELAANPLTRAAHRPASRNLLADYVTVLTNPWARFVLLVTGIEGALVFGVFAYVGADLHDRFGLSFSAIGLIVAAFAVGGLAYAATVRALMARLGQLGVAIGGGLSMALAFLTLALQPTWLLAPIAVAVIGYGFYMLHNTLQTVGTQMSPQARGTALGLFASVYYLGQSAGAALGAPMMDRFGGQPLFAISAIGLPLLALWFARRLKARP